MKTFIWIIWFLKVWGIGWLDDCFIHELHANANILRNDEMEERNNKYEGSWIKWKEEKREKSIKITLIFIIH